MDGKRIHNVALGLSVRLSMHATHSNPLSPQVGLNCMKINYIKLLVFKIHQSNVRNLRQYFEGASDISKGSPRQSEKKNCKFGVYYV